jgi:hypothetical protein
MDKTISTTLAPHDLLSGNQPFQVSQDSLPVVLLELLSPGFTSDPIYAGLGVEVGNSIEVDMRELALINESLASRAFAYYQKCRNFYDNLSLGTPGITALETERTLLSAKQLDTNKIRADLKEECKLLVKLPGLGELIKKLLSNNPDFQSLATSFASAGAKFHKDGLVSFLEFSLPGRESWPLELGGVNSRGELTRVFTLTVSHAPWRDRKSRRLLSLAVSTIELWPEI